MSSTPRKNRLPWCFHLGAVITLLALVALAGAADISTAQPVEHGELNQNAAEPREYTLGVPPFLPPERLELTFAHMAARFSEVLGHKVHFRTSSTHGRFMERVAAEEYDFAFIEPFHFIQIDAEIYLPLAVIPGIYQGVFVTLESSPLSRINELRGRSLAVGPRESGLDYLSAYTLLEQDLVPGVDLSVRRIDTPLSCLQQVLAGTAAACVADAIAIERFADKMSTKLKVLGATVGVPLGPFVAHRRVPQADRDAIRDLMLRWGEDPRNRTSVSGTQMPSLVPSTENMYAPVIKIWETLKER